MKRRGFLNLSGVMAVAVAGPALAQKDLPLVAVLVPGTAKLANDRMAAIRKGLQEAGLAEGVNYAFALRFANGVFDRLPGLAPGTGQTEAARHRRLGGGGHGRSQGRA